MDPNGLLVVIPLALAAITGFVLLRMREKIRMLEEEAEHLSFLLQHAHKQLESYPSFDGWTANLLADSSKE